MKKIILLIIFSMMIFILAETSPLWAQQVPILREQFVYSLNLFNGSGYTQGFAPRSVDTLYMIANENNALVGKFTNVYFWPITGRYIGAFRTLNEDVEGKLEILKEGETIQTREKEFYTLYYPQGTLSDNFKMIMGEEAEARMNEYRKVLEDYNKEMDSYNKAVKELRERQKAVFEKMKEKKERGEKIDLKDLHPEEYREIPQPESPKIYTSGLFSDYIINLPEGTYEIQIRAKDGTIVEDSRKKLVVFSAQRRGEGVGYELIPGSRWTQELNWDDPNKIIYVAGGNTFYLRSFLADEYNELRYRKVVDPQNEGAPERWMWVHVQPLTNVKIVLSEEGKTLEKINRIPYFVKQIPGPELGYEILDYQKEIDPKGYGPSFEGYKLMISSSEGGPLEIFAETQDGKVLKGSHRKIIRVEKEKSDLLYGVAVFPLVVGAVIFIRRKIFTS